MRTLKVKCPTWQHVETFYSRKLRKDRTLTLRVPFEPEEGVQISVGLELPNGEMIAIPGTIIGVSTGEDEDRNAMRLFLHGLDAELLERLKQMVAEAGASTRQAQAPAQAPARPEPPPAAKAPPRSSPEAAPAPSQPSSRSSAQTASAQTASAQTAARAPSQASSQPSSQASGQAAPRAQAPSQMSQPPPAAPSQAAGRADAVPRPFAGASRSGPTLAQPPASAPEDAPVDELIDPPFEPGVDDVSEYERDVFLYLEEELRRMRESAAFEVLGVAEQADVAAIRAAYFELTKRFHPDLFARYRSRAILHMCQELFIHVNKAYDRMRNALVTAGHAIVAGPALIPHDGWLAGMDDIQGIGEDTNISLLRERSYGEEPPSRQGTGDLLALVRAGKFEEARERVAAALHYDPRDRRMRALYHVISGRELMARNEETAAATQFEAALAHDRTCREAREALEELRASGLHSGLYPRTLR